MYLMNKLLELLSFKNTNETISVRKKATPKAISDAFIKVEKEINSLKDYDSGKKEIYALDLRSAVQRIRRTT